MVKSNVPPTVESNIKKPAADLTPGLRHRVGNWAAEQEAGYKVRQPDKDLPNIPARRGVVVEGEAAIALKQEVGIRPNSKMVDGRVEHYQMTDGREQAVCEGLTTAAVIAQNKEVNSPIDSTLVVSNNLARVLSPGSTLDFNKTEHQEIVAHLAAAIDQEFNSGNLSLANLHTGISDIHAHNNRTLAALRGQDLFDSDRTVVDVLIEQGTGLLRRDEVRNADGTLGLDGQHAMLLQYLEKSGAESGHFAEIIRNLKGLTEMKAHPDTAQLFNALGAFLDDAILQLAGAEPTTKVSELKAVVDQINMELANTPRDVTLLNSLLEQMVLDFAPSASPENQELDSYLLAKGQSDGNEVYADLGKLVSNVHAHQELIQQLEELQSELANADRRIQADFVAINNLSDPATIQAADIQAAVEQGILARNLSLLTIDREHIYGDGLRNVFESLQTRNAVLGGELQQLCNRSMVAAGMNDHFQTHQDEGLGCFMEVAGWRISGRTKTIKQLREKYGTPMTEAEKVSYNMASGNVLELYLENFTFELRRSDGSLAKISLDSPKFTPTEYAKFIEIVNKSYHQDRLKDKQQELKLLDEQIEAKKQLADKTGLAELEAERDLLQKNLLVDCQRSDLTDVQIDNLMTELFQFAADSQILENAKVQNISLNEVTLSYAQISGLELENVALNECKFFSCIAVGMSLKNCAVLGGSFEESEMAGAVFDGTKCYGTSFLSTQLQEAVFKGKYGFERGLKADRSGYNFFDELRKYSDRTFLQTLDLMLDRNFGIIKDFFTQFKIFKLGRHCDFREVKLDGSNLITNLKDLYAADKKVQAYRIIRGIMFSKGQDFGDKEFNDYLHNASRIKNKGSESWAYHDNKIVHFSNMPTASTKELDVQARLLQSLGVSVIVMEHEDDMDRLVGRRISFKCFSYSETEPLATGAPQLNFDNTPLMEHWYDMTTYDFNKLMRRLALDNRAATWAKRTEIAWAAFMGIRIVTDQTNRVLIDGHLAEMNKGEKPLATPNAFYEKEHYQYNGRGRRDITDLNSPEVAMLDVIIPSTDPNVAPIVINPQRRKLAASGDIDLAMSAFLN